MGLVLVPPLLPYLAARRELGFERSLSDAQEHRAFFSTFFAPDGRYYLRLLSQPAESSAFVGFTVLALAAISLVWLRRDARLTGGAGVWARIAGIWLVLTLPLLAWVSHSPSHTRYVLGVVKSVPGSTRRCTPPSSGAWRSS